MNNPHYGLGDGQREKLERRESVRLAARVGRGAVKPSVPRWGLEQVAGRLVEVSAGVGATAPLTLAFGLVLEAQRHGEPVAWITPEACSFYPPDAAEGGVDLDALVVVRVPGARTAARAADQLARSGAFDLIVLDLGAGADVPTPLQTRLVGLAQKHRTALLCLTERGSESPSMGSLVSLRVQAWRQRLADGRFSCRLTVLKDKRRGPTWTHAEVCRGPAGLR
jgi:recombination protein RecA